ncbi:hypothetical protein K2173_008589 [Erythroxylum novogranatense]|uniref:Timeless N-terminal domain-containing protein n=1 Tax=Erythroxylum novogranatense TaxID=1862640 RepID=A0AAV8SLH3_9ROSI|nr:hypothetical protein K2173_008589 [Erythroxylum novogranatense]
MDTQGLSIVCAGLGVAGEEENGNQIGYCKGEQCLDNLRDLLRFLRRDDPETREVFKQVCRWNIVSKDLIPIIQYCQDDRQLILNAVKVLVFLTMPIEPSSKDIPQQMEYLWALKSAITCSHTITVVVSLLEGPLENLEAETFTEDDWKMVQLVLTLFRNILAIQEISPLQKVDGSACQLLMLRERFLELLFHENVMDLIIVITQHLGGTYSYLRQDNFLLLEIFHFIFMGQEPELVANANVKFGEGTKNSFHNLKSIMEEEEAKIKLSRSRSMARHSQFAGTFTRLAMDGSKAVYKGSPSSTCNKIPKVNNPHRGPVKKIVSDHGRLPPMKENIPQLLHGLLNQFLSGGFNALTQSIREDIEKEHNGVQNSDVIIFFQVAQFVTSFQYHKFLNSKPTSEDTSKAFRDQYDDVMSFKGDMCGPIAESLNESMFQLVISKWRYSFDGLKETHNYKFLSAACSLMKTMIRMLDLVIKILPEDSKEPQTARILLYKLFYDQTDNGMTQFLLTVIKAFDNHKQPKSDLADLLEMLYVIVRLMENLQSRGTLRVSKKSRGSRKKKAPSGNKETGNELTAGEANVQDKNLLSCSEHLQISEKEIRENASSDHPENNELTVQVDAAKQSVQETVNFLGNLPQEDDGKNDSINDDVSCSADDSSGDEQTTVTCEVDFKVSTFVSTLANHSIIQNLCWLLKFYKSNSTRTNHYIISILRRITDDLDLSPMLYQLSLLITFYDILDEQQSCPCKEYTNVVDFLATLVRRMLRKMKNQPLLFVEVLFWKSKAECHYINAEYLMHELGNMRKGSAGLGSISANEEFGSSRAQDWVPRSIADALGEDEADVVISHELREGHATEHGPERVTKGKRRLVLTDELETRIKDLYDKFKDDGDCSRLIAESLDPDGQISAAQVSNKLKQLGLRVASKKRRRLVDTPTSAEPKQAMEIGTQVQNPDELGRSKQAVRSTRKRVHAFNRDQEEMIKVLYEQFKDHKRCSNMIANALAADNPFTAAQVSRKLKQLGLRVPRKKSEENMHSREDEPGGFLLGEDSDNETLQSLKNRKKNKKETSLFSEESLTRSIDGEASGDSGNDFPSFVPRRINKLGDKHSAKEHNKERNLSGDSDDDQVLSAIAKKTRMVSSAEDKRVAEISNKPSATDDSYVDGVHEDVAERDGGNQPMRMAIDEIENDVSIDRVNKGVDLSVENPSVDNNADDNLYDSLADSEDDVAPPSASIENTSLSSRKSRL